MVVWIEMVKAGPADAGQLRHPLHRHLATPFGLFLNLPNLPTDSRFPVNACSIRCSSMRCKHFF
ncbi:MAG: hypothetical protein HY238_17815 [Acidobacteria bacterium]|nr:hypothetical protein [Acidobacteriota bacterium]